MSCDRRSASARARARSCRELRPRGFLERSVQRGRAALIETLARLARPHGGRWSGRKVRARAISRRSGQPMPARASSPRARSTSREPAGGARHRRAGGRGYRAGHVRRARVVSSAQSRARGGRLRAAHRAHARRPAGSVAFRDLASRLKALPVVTLAPPDDALLRAVLVKLFADRQLAVDESLVGFRGEPDRTLVRGGARRGRTARSRGDAPAAPVNQGAGGGTPAFAGNLDGQPMRLRLDMSSHRHDGRRSSPE